MPAVYGISSRQEGLGSCPGSPFLQSARVLSSERFTASSRTLSFFHHPPHQLSWEEDQTLVSLQVEVSSFAWLSKVFTSLVSRAIWLYRPDRCDLSLGTWNRLSKGLSEASHGQSVKPFDSLASVPGSTAIIVPRTARSASLCATALTVHASRLMFHMTRSVVSRLFVSSCQQFCRVLMNVRAIATFGRNLPHTARLIPLCQWSQQCPVSSFCDT